MKTKNIPQRLCLGCREMKNKSELIRLVKSKENLVFFDKTGKFPGRGAYICLSKVCFEEARKHKRFEKSLGINIEESIYNFLIEQLENKDGE